MCGIAGYNCSQEWAEKYVTGNEQAILKEAWYHNIHRGRDAAGFFALKESDKVKAWKALGSAEELYEDKDKKAIMPARARVFGAHTRAATKGDPKDNSNNHPVYYRDVWVTHNGVIANDEQIKSWHHLKDKENVAEVDSAAIAVLLSEIKDFTDADVLEDALLDLWGSFAIHAVRRDMPGVSVIGKGSGSPLIVGYHPGGCIVYGSTAEAVWGIIDAMGLEVNDDAWQYVDVHDNKVFVVKDGIPINWASFSYHTYHKTKLPYDTMRILPKGDERNFEVVYSTNARNDFANKNGSWGRDLETVPQDDIELIYTEEHGFAKEDAETFPLKNDMQLVSVFSEADKIVKNGKSDLYHIFFGDIEIISSSRTVQDVYDHGKFKTDERWYLEQRDVEKPEDRIKPETWSMFLKAASREITHPHAPTMYAYNRRQSNIYEMPGNRRSPVHVEKGKGSEDNLPVPFRVPETQHGGKVIVDGRQKLEPDVWLEWNNIAKEVVVNGHDEGFCFLNKKWRCPLHGNVLLEDHANPSECSHVVGAAAWTLAASTDLTVSDFLLGNKATLAIGYDEASDPCPSRMHEWMSVKFGRVHIPHDRYYEFTLGEVCIECGTTYNLVNLPGWLENVIATRKDYLLAN